MAGMASSQTNLDVQMSSSDDEAQVRADLASANLQALGALLELDGTDEAFARVFAAIDKVFSFDRAMVLEVAAGVVRCLAAAPGELIGVCWPGTFFEDVLDGRVLVAGDGLAVEDWRQVPTDLVAPDQPALCFPVGVGSQRAALLLMRMADKPGFSDGEVATARQCAVVTLAAVAMRTGQELEAEIQRLKATVAQMRESGQTVERDRGLLKDIIDALPSGVTVQDDQGRYVLVNSAAATSLSVPAERLIGASPAAFLPEEEGSKRHQDDLGQMQRGQSSVLEEIVNGPAGARTFLTLRKPVRLRDRTLLLSTAYDITERKQAEDDLTQRAYFDELTGLPNRLLIQGHVEDILRQADNGRQCALAFIDLDNFKHINDYYSHAIGDALLVKVAQRIGSRLRETDVLSRISGDEFLLVLNPVASEDEVRTTINHLIEDLKQPFYIEAFEIFTSASIGVSFYPTHGDSYEALRRNADNAMYRAKAGTKGDAVYFDVAMGRTITARMEHEQRLRLAIRDRRFVCAYQPKVDIHTQDVVGFETLVRWRDDDGEIHPPSTFVSLAVELGLIDPITHFILAETIRSIDRLDDSFGPGTSFSINVAAKQASDLKFMRSLVDAIKESNHAERIMLEVTEDAFIAKGQFQIEVLPMLRDIGVRVSIDDFGTGYSSLSVLSEITADELKVDRSFITDIHRRPRSQSILKTIESLGQSLGMSIIAEGVETHDELAYLHAATRIRYAQGFYFSKPFYLDDMPAKRVAGDGRDFESAREPAGRRRLAARGSGTDG
jgi:diguanylate cyclase (GGDEF)-like protein/PAS domain S-box-containing protein